MMGCSFCGITGCGYDTCPKRLEELYGVPSDYDDEGERVEVDEDE